MKQEGYDFMENVSDHWFFNIRKDIFINLIKKINKDENAKVLDMGCGNGYFLAELSKDLKNCYGVDGYEYEHKLFDKIEISDIRKTNFEENMFDFVTMLDVMEHIEFEKDLLDEVKRVMKDKGYLLLSVPANEWLFSETDVVYQHYRRYSKKSLRKVLENNGFTIKRIGFFNSLLFSPFVMSRLLEKITKKSTVHKSLVGGVIGKLFYTIFSLEKPLLKVTEFPYGGSLLAVAQYNKKDK